MPFSIKPQATEPNFDTVIGGTRDGRGSIATEQDAVLSHEDCSRALRKLINLDFQSQMMVGNFLTWIIHARRPLSANELLCALQYVPGASEAEKAHCENLQHLITLCEGLVVHDTQPDRIRLAAGALDFFKTREFRDRFPLPDGETLIARTCAEFLSRHASHLLDEDPHESLYNAKWALYWYATRNWVSHARDCPELADEIIEFLSSIPEILRQEFIPESATHVVPTSDIGTSLHVAAAHNMEIVAERILEFEDALKQINKLDSRGRTPLIWAVILGEDTMFERLMNVPGVDIHLRDYHTGQTPLLWACKKKNSKIVERLLHEGADPNARNKLNQTPLYQTLQLGTPEVMRLLLQHGADPDEKVHGKSPIHWAAIFKRTKGLKFLLESGASPNTRDIEGKTPFLHAAEQGFGDGLEFLMRLPSVDKNQQDGSGATALHLLLKAGDVKNFLNLCTLETININLPDLNGRTPLHDAAKLGFKDVVGHLIHLPTVDKNYQDSKGSAAVHLAAKKGHSEVIEVLCTGGANVNSKDCLGFTPLHVIASTGVATDTESVKTLQALLNHGADPNVENSAKETALFCAVRHENDYCYYELLDRTSLSGLALEELIQKLMSQADRKGDQRIVALLQSKNQSISPSLYESTGILPWAAGHGHHGVIDIAIAQGLDMTSFRNREDRNILWTATENGWPAIIESLLRANQFDLQPDADASQLLLWTAIVNHQLQVLEVFHTIGGFDLNFPNQNGETPLLWASKQGDEELVNLILRLCKQIDCMDKYHCTALHYASKYGFDSIVKSLLVDGRLDVNSKDEVGETPLSAAVQNGHIGVVRSLLSQESIDPTIENRDGTSAVDFAIQNDQMDIVKILLEDGRVL